MHTIPWDEVPSVERTDAPSTTERELPIADHVAAFGVMLEAFEAHGPSLTQHRPVAVGHRVVHGGKRFFEPTVVNDLVKINIADLAELAPLHNPANLQGIEAAQQMFPDVPHVVVFDTAFHQTLPPAAYTYAIDRRGRRAVPGSALRVPRHLAQVRLRAGGAVGRAAARRAEAVGAAPRQRRVDHRRRRRPVGRDLDGDDPARGPRHGHAFGRHRPRGARAPAPPGRGTTSTRSTRC